MLNGRGPPRESESQDGARSCIIVLLDALDRDASVQEEARNVVPAPPC